MRSLRCILLALMLSVLFMLLAAANARGVHAQVSSTPDSLPSVQLVRIAEQAACDTCLPLVCPGPFKVEVMGRLPNRCWYVTGVVLVPPPPSFAASPPTVRILLDGNVTDPRCRSFPGGFVVDTMLTGLPSGSNALPVELVSASADSVSPVPLFAQLYRFRTLPSCSTSVPRVDLTLAPAKPCAGDSVSVLVSKRDCAGCVQVLRAALEVDGPLVVRYLVYDAASCDSLLPCLGPWPIGLGRFMAGSYVISTLITEVHVHGDGSRDSLMIPGTLSFQVGACPMPLDLSSTVHVAGQLACDSCATPVTCPARPIPVRVEGTFPTSCGHVRRVEFLPSLLPVVGPPTMRILLDSEECLMRPCLMFQHPWVVDTVLPPLPRGTYGWRVEVAQVSCSDSILDGRVLAKVVPFKVSVACSTTTAKGCFIPSWGPTLPGTACNAFVTPGNPGDVQLLLRSNVSLAGLQGVLHAGPAVSITGLAGIGPAAGMTLQWTPTADGARFVMFATSGAPIPGTPFGDTLSLPSPVLRVTVGLTPGSDSRLLSVVRADSLLGADSLARAVTPCPDLTMRPFIPGAQVCIGTSCDVNGDGRSDVRDLVLMVHCILGGGACPDTVAGRHDCNGDGRADLDDILCCARAILQGMPHDSLPGRSEPDVTLRFGDALATGDHLRVPITLEGADHVGALRMALRYPSDRYTVNALSTEAGVTWLALDQVQGADVVVGLIALTPPAAGASVPMTLDLVLKPGAEHGGELSVSSADVSAPDGTTLATHLTEAVTPLVTVTRVALAIHPNPLDAGGATVGFALPRAAAVDLAVYDVAGRRVATLAHGTLTAGTYARTWDAAGARDGVYFVRLRADGVELAHKAVLRRGR